MKVFLCPIGVLHTPFPTTAECPRQGSITKFEGEAEIFQEYAPGLKDLEKFSHLWLIYKFDKTGPLEMIVTPLLDGSAKRGLFATRHFCRPNPIGLTVVKTVEIKGNRVRFIGADMIDGTELLDIKPYVSEIDCPKEAAKSGWLEGLFEDKQKS